MCGRELALDEFQTRVEQGDQNRNVSGMHVWAVRTADGRYANIELVSYECPRAQPTSLPFRYVYQGGGARVVGGKPSRAYASSLWTSSLLRFRGDSLTTGLGMVRRRLI